MNNLNKFNKLIEQHIQYFQINPNETFRMNNIKQNVS